MTETITVNSAALGQQTVPAEAVFTMLEPMIGHDVVGSWVEIEPPHQSGSGMTWLQSLEHPNHCFCVLDVFAAGLDLDLEVSPQQIAALHEDDPEHIRVLAVVVLDNDPKKIRANLRAPLLLAPRQKVARQVVLADESLPVQWFLAGLPPRATLAACSS
jgi:flagellar assembly factor FliW